MGAASSREADVVVVGGGPAGAAAALTLLAYSALSVVLVEGTGYTEPRIGETVPPGVRPLLAYLGVWERFAAAGHLPAPGTSAAWGGEALSTRDFLFTGRGEGWHLDRAVFDRDLAAAVAERGGAVRTGEPVVAVAPREGGGWTLDCRRADGTLRRIAARYLVDASGRRAVLARHLGARKEVFDRLVGVAGFLVPSPGARRGADPRDAAVERSAGAPLGAPSGAPLGALIEARRGGWWYSALLPGGRAVAAFMTDADAVRAEGLAATERWCAELAGAPHTAARLAGHRLEGPLIVRPAHSHRLLPAAGAGWVAAGDAAAAFDPLASLGIGHALTSGAEAARVAADALGGDGRLAAAYAASVEANVARYLDLRQSFYRLEGRWRDEPFWSRRQQEVGALAA